MKTRLLVIAALACLFAGASSVPALSPDMVVSQVYGGGGNSGATYTHDFIELFNRGASPVNISGWSVQYASATGTTWQVTTLSGTVQPGRYFLVQQAQGSGGTTPLPTPDATGTIAMSATNGKLALVNTTTALTGSCPTGAQIVDFVGFGGTASCFEGGGPTATLSNTTAAIRLSGGCTETDNNNTDFATGAPTPRNSASPINYCGDAPPSVDSTSPANGATGVAIDANLTITFSEAVNVAGSWFSISCTTSGAHPATVSGGPVVFTLDPTADFVNSETCTATVFAAQVTDQDADDPPDNMVADYVWSFSTLSLASISIEKSTNGQDADTAPGPSVPVGSAVTWTYEVTNTGVDPLSDVTVTDDQGVMVTCPGTTLAAGESMTCTANGTAVAGQYANVGSATGTPPSGPDVGDSDPSHYFGVTFVINEIHADPHATQGDANGDGVSSTTQDEFVELVNATAGPIDISGWTLSDAVQVRHTFPPGTVVPGGCAAVVFGGGSLVAYFGGSVVQVASTGSLGLNNSNETVTLSDGVGPVASVFYGSEGGNDQSITLVPDVTGSLPWVQHTAAPGSGGLRYSPGRKVDRTLFGGCGAPPLSFVHDVQGTGAVSPLAGLPVRVEGVVTGLKSNGFFLQEEESDYDADPATSEGIFVFTGFAPPAAVAVGNVVSVVGVVTEYVPSADPLQPPLTEIVTPGVTFVSAGNPLPTPVILLTILPDPAGAFDQLERFEGMRVSVPSMTVVAPTRGNISEANATATSNGIFSGVVTGVARPFRETGIQQPDHDLWPAPATVPEWDNNPETITVDSDGIGGTRLDVGTGAVITGLVGPLDYGFRRYTLLPDPGLILSVSGGPTPVAVTLPGAGEITVASYNVQRFFDTANDPATSDPVLTPAAWDLRLAKLSDGVRNYLRFPDVLSLQEVENLTTMQAIAARISADALAAGQTDPLYVAYLSEGNDIGGIDVGFLVKTAQVAPGVPRVANVVVTQVGLNEPGALWDDPDDGINGVLVPFNDRPPLVLTGVVNGANGATFPLTVIGNHLRSFGGVGDPRPLNPPGVGTASQRSEQKRLLQAQYLANLVQTRQVANPTERIVVIGDMNAYQFSDGFVDSLGTIAGTPVPDDQTIVPGDGTDLVNPDLVNLLPTAPAAQRYSYVFDGQAQTIDHVLVNAATVTDTVARRIEHARINSDWPEVVRDDAPDALRLSDHDPVVLYLAPLGFATADLSITKGDSPDPVVAGTNLTYSISVGNAGPDPATDVLWVDTLPTNTTFVSLAFPGGWGCSAPPAGGTGTVSCATPSLAVGSAVFTLVVNVAPTLATGTVISNTAAITGASSTDPNPANDTATATTTVRSEANFSLTKADGPDPVTVGNLLTYTLTVVNPGPSHLLNASVTDTLPAGLTLQSAVAPAGWTCSGAVTCTNPSVPVGSHVITITALVDAAVPGGTVLTNTALLTASTLDPVPGDTQPSVTTTVLAPVAFTATKTFSGSLQPGSIVTYTIALTNAGPGSQPDLAGDELVDVLPPELDLLSATADLGTALADPPSGTVTWNGALAAGETVTITIEARIGLLVPTGTVIANQATFTYDGDGDGTAEATGVSDDPAVAGTEDPTVFEVGLDSVLEIPTLGPAGLALLALLLAAAAAVLLWRRRAA